MIDENRLLPYKPRKFVRDDPAPPEAAQ